MPDGVTDRLLGPPVGAWLVPRVRTTRALLGLSILTVVLLVLAPTGREVAMGCVVEWTIPTLGAVEVMANLILFTPVVLLAGIATRRPLAALLLGSAASALLEVVQASAPMLGRSCSTNDWWSNTLGALLGAVLAAAALRLRAARSSCSR